MKFSEQVIVTGSTDNVTLTGMFNCFLLVFTSDQIDQVDNCHDGAASTSFYSFKSYKYAFVNNKLYSDAAKSYIGVFYNDGTEYRCTTGNLAFEKGKYYVYNTIAGGFTLPKMESGTVDEMENEKEEDMPIEDAITITLPPDNEIWYTSTTGTVVELPKYPCELVSNTYENGQGKFTFATNVTNLGKCFSDLGLTDKNSPDFLSLVFPASIETLDTYRTLAGLRYATSIVLPRNVTNLGMDFLGSFGDKSDNDKHLYFLSETPPSSVSSLAFWNQGGTMYVYYPKGADYSIVKNALQSWVNEYTHPDFTYVMVETEYNIQ